MTEADRDILVRFERRLAGIEAEVGNPPPFRAGRRVLAHGRRDAALSLLAVLGSLVVTVAVVPLLLGLPAPAIGPPSQIGGDPSPSDAPSGSESASPMPESQAPEPAEMRVPTHTTNAGEACPAALARGVLVPDVEGVVALDSASGPQPVRWPRGH